MPGSASHPRPDSKGYGGGAFANQKCLFLHGPGSTAKLCQAQANAMFAKLPWVTDFKIFEWHFWEGTIKNTMEEIHADPIVQKVFAPYGPDFFSYIVQENINRQDECWTPLDEVLDRLAEKLAADGPFDGLCGFDMGGQLALSAAVLAQEGDPRFAKQFRYLMLFSTSGLKEMSAKGMGALRPKAPLQIDTFLGWSEFDDDARSFPCYEDMCLYIHPKHRAIIVHDQGHRPPNIQKGTENAESLQQFIGMMQSAVQLKHHADGKPIFPAGERYSDCWLPMVREPAPQIPNQFAEDPRLLIVVGDPQGVHGPEPAEAETRRLDFPAQEHPENCKLRLGIYRAAVGATAADFEAAVARASAGSCVQVHKIEYQEKHRTMSWNPTTKPFSEEARRSRWVQAEDEIIVPWQDLHCIAHELLEDIPWSRGQPVGIVGIGAGAHLAWALAEAYIKSRQEILVGFWSALAPTVWPRDGAPGPGALVTTPIRYLTCASAVTGPPWRLETSTYGPFSHGHFTTKEEMADMVVGELQAVSVSDV